MKTLYLLRHAKSCWNDPALTDFERPLASRGRRATAAVGQHLRRSGVALDRVLCSPACRAVETARRVLAAMEAPLVVVDFYPDLYLTGWLTLLTRVRALPDTVDRAMVVAHNPDIQALAEVLVGAGAPPLRRALAEKFPTAALAVLHFPVLTWGAVAPGTGGLDDFVTPCDLTVRFGG